MNGLMNHTKLLIGITIGLSIFTNACELTLLSSDPVQNDIDISMVDVALTNQGVMQTSVAKTVEALGPVASKEPAVPFSDSDESFSSSSPIDTPPPCNKPHFQSETIPDEANFEPGDAFTKSWTIRNDGSCVWTTEYRLVFIDGDQMNGPDSKTFSAPINPGESVSLSVDLIAPDKKGKYTGTWKIQADDGEEFGDYWASITVIDPEEEAAPDFSVSNISFTNSDQIKVGFCPHTFNIQAEIKVNGKGTVKYHWIISNGFETQVESMRFDGPGTKTAVLEKSLSCDSADSCSYVVELYIDSPNDEKFGEWSIVVHCM